MSEALDEGTSLWGMPGPIFAPEYVTLDIDRTYNLDANAGILAGLGAHRLSFSVAVPEPSAMLLLGSGLLGLLGLKRKFKK